MAGQLKFIKDYGDISFTEMPFCDIDNITLCQIFYLPFERTAPNSLDDKPEAYPEVFRKYYEFRGGRHRGVGLVLPRKISVQAEKMANCRRYAEMKVVGATETFQISPAIQFGAVTFLLPDGTNVVVFRGTDDSIIGWIEDLDMYTKKGIPSHKLAVDYLNAVAEKFEGDIIVCGHSKGANVALYAALNCKKEVRDRITRLYNNDGPGFHNMEFTKTGAYSEILPRYRHFIPHGSLVGLLLAHDEDYTVVKSMWRLGPLEHDMGSWKIKGTELVRAKRLSPVGRFNDLGFGNLVFRLTDEQNEVLDDVVEKIVEGSGELYLLGLIKNLGPAVFGAVKAWKSLDSISRDEFKNAFKGSGKLFAESAKYVKDETLPLIKKRAENIKTALFA